MKITTGKILKYALLPEILPRLKALFGMGFGHLAGFMAHTYAAARLLPPGHPYLSPANLGRFGIRHVIAEAGRNVQYRWASVDQVIVHAALVTGIFILFMQIGLAAAFLLMQTAYAGDVGSYWSSFFTTPNPREDLAFIMLDRVFGLPGIFGSKVALIDAPWPNSFHRGLLALFNFYNYGIALVSIIVILYFIVALVGETAKTGIPFGKRFNHAWAPVRLILAIFLLVPIGDGLNFAQYTTLHVAKWGSGFATNSWILFNTRLAGETLMGKPENLVATPTPPALNTVLEFIFVAAVCEQAYYYMYGNSESPHARNGRRNVSPYLVYEKKDPADYFSPGTAGVSLDEMLEYTENHDIVVRFGEYDPEQYDKETSFVKPLCGELKLSLQDIEEPGARMIIHDYIMFFLKLLYQDDNVTEYSFNVVCSEFPCVSATSGNIVKDTLLDQPNSEFVNDLRNRFKNVLSFLIKEAVDEQIEQGHWIDELAHLGWGGAGIWYNKIAQMNGSLISAVNNLPVAVKYPEVMEQVAKQRRASDESVWGPTRFDPNLSDGQTVQFSRAEDRQLAEILYRAQSLFFDEQSRSTGNFMIEAIKMIFGIDGLFNMRENTEIHPLAQIVAIGRGMIESAIMNFGFSFGAGAVGGIASLLGNAPVGTVGASASAFASHLAMLGIALGFILFYVIPFLPFLYFFFAVGSWVKTIFEAMVGLPLWALSHIRIDGEGIPGPAGMNGYYMIFEIFIRPVLIIFGLVAGIAIFTAQVQILNEIWDMVVSNLTGFSTEKALKLEADGIADGLGSLKNVTSVADQLFYTVIYTIFVYMMAMSSFKMVDQIPNSLLRWMGSSVSIFSGHGEEDPSSLVQKTFSGSQQMMGDTQGAMQGLMMRN